MPRKVIIELKTWLETEISQMEEFVSKGDFINHPSYYTGYISGMKEILERINIYLSST